MAKVKRILINRLEYDRALAKRVLRRAVAIAERNGDVFSNQKALWSIMVDMSHRKHGLKIYKE